jgi:hypothetical protein
MILMSFVRKVATVLGSSCARGFRSVLLASATFLLPLQSVYAGVPNQLCLASATGLENPSCTANDLIIPHITVVDNLISCSDGSLIVVDVEITVESAVERYDVGLWINQAGLSARSDIGLNCFRDALEPVGTAETCNHFPEAPALPDYYNLDGDACGDVYAANTNPCGTAVVTPCTAGGGTCLLTRRFAQLEVACIDTDGDGTVDTGICTSWNNNDETVCNGPLDAVPGTGSQCSCSDNVAIHNLFFEPALEEIFLNGFETE